MSNSETGIKREVHTLGNSPRERYKPLRNNTRKYKPGGINLGIGEKVHPGIYHPGIGERVYTLVYMPSLHLPGTPRRLHTYRTRYHGNTRRSSPAALTHHVTELFVSDGPLTVVPTRFTVGR